MRMMNARRNEEPPHHCYWLGCQHNEQQGGDQEELNREAHKEEQPVPKSLLVSEEMRAALIIYYMPGITQTMYVLDKHKTVAEALTIGGDHFAPCKCIHSHGWSRWMLLDHIQHPNDFTKSRSTILYGNFVDNKYSYLQSHADRQIGLPCRPHPFCIENVKTHLFLYEHNWLFVDFQSSWCSRAQNRVDNQHRDIWVSTSQLILLLTKIIYITYLCCMHL